MTDDAKRLASAIDIATEAGRQALAYFRDRDALVIDRKGHQDWVTEADRNVELLIRRRLADDWPDDSIVGEEHAPMEGTSGFSWVIDPIDGTANFVNGIPTWCVVLAGVSQGQTRIGVIHDPNYDETFVAIRGGGATLNGKPMRVAEGKPLNAGTVAIGYSNRIEAAGVFATIQALNAEGAMFVRNASGAVSLAYVAAGRYLGYIEEHMNAWDCLAGQLLIAEAGGIVEEQDAEAMIATGGRVIAGAPQVFDRLLSIARSCWPAHA